MNRIYVALVVGGLMSTFWWIAHRHNASVEERIREVETGVPAFDQEEFRKSTQQARDRWKDATQAVAAHNLPAASRAYADLHSGAIQTYAQHYAQTEVDPGVTVLAWQARQEEAFRSAVMEALPGWFERLASGELPVAVCKQFLTDLDALGFKEPQQEFKKAETRITAERARAAANWLRLDVSPASPEYEQVLFEALRAKWNPRYGFKLVSGYALSPLEERATWKTLRVRLEQTEARYEVRNRQSWGNVTPPVIPRQIHLTFTSEGTPEVPMTWNPLGPVTVSVDVPQTLTVKEEDAKDRARIKSLEERKKRELLSALGMLLAKIPSFELFPGIDPAKLTPRNGDQLDLAAVRALGYLDKPRLTAQLQELTSVPGFHVPIATLAVELTLEPLAPWVAQILPTLPTSARRDLHEQLKRKPWFGDHNVLVAFVQTEPPNDSSERWDVLQGQLSVPKVRQAVLEQIACSTQRHNLALRYIQEAPLDELGLRTAAWLTDTNEGFVRTTILALGNRAPETAAQAALEAFPRVPDPIKVVLLEQLGRARSQTQPGPGLYAAVATSLRSSHEPLRQSGSQFLLQRAYEPAAWDMLREVFASETNPRRKDEIQQKLVLNARRAHPESAQDFLLEQVRATTNHIRQSALFELIGQDNPTQELFVGLVRATEAQPRDLELRRTIVRALHQHHRLRRGWNFPEEHTALTALLISGLQDPDPAMRRKSEEIILFAMQQKGAQHLAQYVSLTTNSPDPTAGPLRVQAREPQPKAEANRQ